MPGVLFGLALFSWRSPAEAQLVIDVQDHALLPNTAGQSFDLSVKNTGNTDVQVGGLVFEVQIADGQDATSAPVITGTDILAGTIFPSSSTFTNYAASSPHFWNVNATVLPNPGTVPIPANSTTKIATITIDTTGFSTPGASWTFALGTTRDGANSTHYLDGVGGSIFATITDGHLSIVPEPNSAFLVSGILVVVATLWRVKRRSA
jgi:hypothetical protein